MNENEKEHKGQQPCDPCERNFERNIHQIVREGEAPTAEERARREHEVEEAFARKKEHERSGNRRHGIRNSSGRTPGGSARFRVVWPHPAE